MISKQTSTADKELTFGLLLNFSNGHGLVRFREDCTFLVIHTNWTRTKASRGEVDSRLEISRRQLGTVVSHPAAICTSCHGATIPPPRPNMTVSPYKCSGNVTWQIWTYKFELWRLGLKSGTHWLAPSSHQPLPKISQPPHKSDEATTTENLSRATPIKTSECSPTDETSRGTTKPATQSLLHLWQREEASQVSVRCDSTGKKAEWGRVPLWDYILVDMLGIKAPLTHHVSIKSQANAHMAPDMTSPCTQSRANIQDIYHVQLHSHPQLGL